MGGAILVRSFLYRVPMGSRAYPAGQMGSLAFAFVLFGVGSSMSSRETVGSAPVAPRCLPPNMRLKLTGVDRFRGNGVFAPGRAQTFVHYPCASGRVARSLSAIR